MKVFDELAYEEGYAIIAECNGVARKAGQLVNEGDQGLEVFFDREVEGVAVFEVDGDTHNRSDLFDGQKMAWLAVLAVI